MKVKDMKELIENMPDESRIVIALSREVHEDTLGSHVSSITESGIGLESKEGKEKSKPIIILIPEAIDLIKTQAHLLQESENMKKEMENMPEENKESLIKLVLKNKKGESV